MAKAKRVKPLKSRLQTAIGRLVQAEVSDSWKGGGDPADFPAIEAELRAAKKQLKAVLKDVERLLQGAQAAYWHLDTYGVVQGDEREIENQKKVFELLRDFCPPIPGKL